MRFLIFLAIAASAGAAYVPGKAFDRFITIWLENQDFSAVEKNSDISSLAKEGVLLTEYYGLTHPSQPNYIASVGGDYFGLNHDGFVRIPQNVSTVVDLFDSRNIEWRGYFEGIPGPGYMGEGSTAFDGNGWDYVRKHNPFVSYDSINLNGTRLANLLSFTDFQSAVASNTLPQYAHLSPDMLNDGHNTSLQYAATWTQAFLAPLIKNKSFMNRTLILLTYDESATYPLPNHIVSLLLGDAVPSSKKGTTDNTLYTHYSILSTLENNWDLPNLGRYDVGANVFQLVADVTGYTNHAPSNMASVNNSLSYSGFLNSDPKKFMPVPPPNVLLVGAGGQGVDKSVKNNWEMRLGDETPYDGSGMLFDGGDGVSAPNAPIYRAQAVGPNVTSTVGMAAPSGKSGAGRKGVNSWVWIGVLGLAFWL